MKKLILILALLLSLHLKSQDLKAESIKTFFKSELSEYSNIEKYYTENTIVDIDGFYYRLTLEEFISISKPILFKYSDDAIYDNYDVYYHVFLICYNSEIIFTFEFNNGKIDTIHIIKRKVKTKK